VKRGVRRREEGREEEKGGGEGGGERFGTRSPLSLGIYGKVKALLSILLYS
jgi:hypothetical protein